SDSIYFDRYSRYDEVGACESLDSPTRDWYFFAEGGGPCAGDTDYTAWFGFDSLPKLDSSNQAVRDLIFASGPDAVARYWMQYADGWRLDVSGDIDQGVTGSPDNDYWELFREAVHATNPDAYIVGEEWGNASSWVLGNEWDATMNYQFSSAVLGFWRDTPFTDNDHNVSSSAGVIDPLAPSQLWEALTNLEERYPEEAYLAMMNLLGSHDTNRALFMLDHNAAEGSDDTLLDDPGYDWSDALRRLQGVAILQMTLPGAPTIYYGDEVGLVGPTSYVNGRWEDDPYNRVTYPWLDDDLGTPFYTHLQDEEAQEGLFDYYAALTEARNEHPALRTGDLDLLVADDVTGVLAYGRWIDEKRGGPGGDNSESDKADAAIIVVNRGTTDQTLTLDLAGYLGAKTKIEDVLTGDDYRVGDDGSLQVTVTAGSGLVLVPTHQIASRPDAAAGLTVTAERAGEVDLVWSPVGDRIEYDVYRTLLSGGGYELVGTTAGTSFADVGLTNAVEYHYVVVARDTKTLLEGGWSNEASGVPHYDLNAGWFDLVWPFTITHTISTENPTETVFGQVWLDGVTGAAGPAEGVAAEVGFGVTGSDPATWTWTEMEYVGPGGFAPNNDEHAGSMAPDLLGTYDYTVRWSSDGGRTWLLSPTWGTMNVEASTDTIAPSASVLEVAATGAASVSLAWTAATDNVAVAGYEVFRDGVEIAEVDGTEYTDTGVVTGETYTYVVRAFDTSWNRSSPSNEVTATAEPVVVDVTFLVTVPTNTTGTVYVAGSFPSPLPFWDPGGIALTATSNANEWSVTLSLFEGTEVEYKYTRGDWESVEKDANCDEIANRTMRAEDQGGGAMTVSDTVEKWRDLDSCP
ncbi:MAG: alpha-amylase family glycosyl hydrolase, partial [Actinomycetota bacterium]|nr:alpha-amylase family glycosyl hydrolase [Actinomycetota bacterium]